MHSTALSSLVEAVGGIAVSIPFAEVYTSLQRGVADCAATSSVAGNTQKWYEVSSWIVTLPLGWAISAHVAHKGFWDGLDDLRRNWQEDRRWVPAMDQAERDRLYVRWQQAVERTLDWA